MFNKSPLPFIGQKRNFIKYYIQILKENIPPGGEGWTIVDAFGGSGLLSHVAKHTLPYSRVIYNDYDKFLERVKNIPDTNRLRRSIYAILSNYTHNKRLTPYIENEVLNCIEQFDGYIDIHCLSVWLLFSGHQVTTINEIKKKNWYNRVPQKDYPDAGDYFDGIEITRMDYKDLIPEYRDNNRALLVLDPPYITTDKTYYCLDRYFGMVEFLELMKLIRRPFIIFSSTKSELMDYINFTINYRGDGYETFKDYRHIKLNTNLNYCLKYEDNLVYKF